MWHKIDWFYIYWTHLSSSKFKFNKSLPKNRKLDQILCMFVFCKDDNFKIELDRPS